MPTPTIIALAKKADISQEKAEEYWQEAKKQAAKQNQKDNYAYIMSIFKNMLGLSEDHMTTKDMFYSLTHTTRTKQTEALSKLTKAAIATGATALTTKLLTLSSRKPSQYKNRVNLIQLAKQVAQGRTKESTLEAIVPMLHILSNILLKMPEYRDLAFRLQQIIQSERFEEFF